jgi:hypothetical protein
MLSWKSLRIPSLDKDYMPTEANLLNLIYIDLIKDSEWQLLHIKGINIIWNILDIF